VDLPLSYAQERLWFLDRLAWRGPAYNIAGTLKLQGVVDAAAVAASVTELVRRHEGLRTRFVSAVSGEGLQVVDPPAEVGVP
jgi:hypothetical protein